MPRQTDLRYTFEPEGGEAFDVVAFTLSECLSEPFVLNIHLSSTNAEVDFGQIVDQPALFTIWRGQTAVRRVHGLISGFTQGTTGFRRTRYQAIVEPILARAGLRSSWRIFQQQSVPEILQHVVKGQGITGYAQHVATRHATREYCVQVAETDLEFLARLAAEEGLIYGFEHDEKGHALIHTDRVQSLGDIEGEPVVYDPAPGGDQASPGVRRFSYTEQVRTAQQIQRDYTFKNPRYAQEHSAYGRDTAHQGTDYERYDYPGRYKRDAAGKPFTNTRLMSLRRDARVAHIEGDDARIEPGKAFDLTGHPRKDWNANWRAVRVTHQGKQLTSQQEESADSEQGTYYGQQAELIPGRADWKAPIPHKPRIDGPHMATVTGPEGEEIYCDEWGRIKVLFPWDRDGQRDEHSSCWIRVSQNWAGAMWGHMAVPRIGQEVIVDFLDGDPDQPIVTGRTYHAANLPPYKLPDHKTRMSIKSQTHKGEGYNELRFEDEKDLEEVYIHAQKDKNTHVKNNQTLFVGVDSFDEIKNNHVIEIGQNKIEKIGNHRHDTVGVNHEIKIGGNALTEIEGNYLLSAGQKIVGNTQVLQLNTQDTATIRGPGGTITIDGGGITIEGLQIKFKGPMSVESSGAGNAFAIQGSPSVGEPICLECWLKAARQRKALVPTS